MALGMEVGLGPGHIVLGRDPAPLPRNGGTAPNFRPMSIVASGRPSQLLLNTFFSFLRYSLFSWFRAADEADPSSRVATIHQRHRQTGRQDRADNASAFGRTKIQRIISEQCQVHAGEEDHARPAWIDNIKTWTGQDSLWKSQSE